MSKWMLGYRWKERGGEAEPQIGLDWLKRRRWSGYQADGGTY